MGVLTPTVVQGHMSGTNLSTTSFAGPALFTTTDGNLLVFIMALRSQGDLSAATVALHSVGGAYDLGVPTGRYEQAALAGIGLSVLDALYYWVVPSLAAYSNLSFRPYVNGAEVAANAEGSMVELSGASSGVLSLLQVATKSPADTTMPETLSWSLTSSLDLTQTILFFAKGQAQANPTLQTPSVSLPAGTTTLNNGSALGSPYRSRGRLAYNQVTDGSYAATSTVVTTGTPGSSLEADSYALRVGFIFSGGTAATAPWQPPRARRKVDPKSPPVEFTTGWLR